MPVFVTLLLFGYAAMPLSQAQSMLQNIAFVNAVKVSCSSSRHRDFLLSTSPSLLRLSSFASNQPTLLSPVLSCRKSVVANVVITITTSHDYHLGLRLFQLLFPLPSPS